MKIGGRHPSHAADLSTDPRGLPGPQGGQRPLQQAGLSTHLEQQPGDLAAELDLLDEQFGDQEPGDQASLPAPRRALTTPVATVAAGPHRVSPYANSPAAQMLHQLEEPDRQGTPSIQRPEAAWSDLSDVSKWPDPACAPLHAPITTLDPLQSPFNAEDYPGFPEHLQLIRGPSDRYAAALGGWSYHPPAELPSAALDQFGEELRARAFFTRLPSGEHVLAAPEESALRFWKAPGAAELAIGIGAERIRRLCASHLDPESQAELEGFISVIESRPQGRNSGTHAASKSLGGRLIALAEATKLVAEADVPNYHELFNLQSALLITAHLAGKKPYPDAKAAERHLGKRAHEPKRHDTLERLGLYKPKQFGNDPQARKAGTTKICLETAAMRLALFDTLRDLESNGLLRDEFLPSRLTHITPEGLQEALRKVVFDAQDINAQEELRQARGSARNDLSFLGTYVRDMPDGDIAAEYLAEYFGFYLTQESE